MKGLLFIIMLLGVNLNAQVDMDSTIAAIERRIALPQFSNYRVDVTDYGAKGNGIADDKKAFDKAMKACKRKGGGTIVVSKGVYVLNGPIHFVSHVNLYLEEGAVLRFGSNPEDYPLVLTSWEGTMVYNYSPMIYGVGLENIAITGKGTIDGEGGSAWADWKVKEGEGKQLTRDMNHNKIPVEERVFGDGHFLRPQLIQFVDSKQILIEDVVIEDAPFWCVHLLKCQNATLRGLRYNSHNKNNDGIDLEYSQDILIENITFDNGDDNIAIKAGRDHEGRANSAIPSKNIIVRNCKFKGLHAVVIGSEMSAGVENVIVYDCTAVGYLKRGIYFKTNSDRGGYIRDIYISNLKFLEVEDCIYMTSNYHGEGEGNFPAEISNVLISNIGCGSASNAGIVIEGDPYKKVENVSLRDISIGYAKNGLTILNAQNTILENVVIGEQQGVPSSVK